MIEADTLVISRDESGDDPITPVQKLDPSQKKYTFEALEGSDSAVFIVALRRGKAVFAKPVTTKWGLYAGDTITVRMRNLQ